VATKLAQENELYPDAWERFERAVDAAVKSGPKRRKVSQKEAAIRPPKSPTYAEPMIVCGVEKRDGKWRPFEPYCLLPDGRIESLNLSSSG
jgi:hypothetical protein